MGKHTSRPSLDSLIEAAENERKASADSKEEKTKSKAKDARSEEERV